MPPPLHVAAFERFNGSIPDHLEATIAFGLFLVSEREWANAFNPPLNAAAYATFHQNYLTPHEIWRYHQQALQLLPDFGTRVVEAKRPEFLGEALSEYRKSAAAGHSAFRGFGILEAIAGALAWTVVLIIFSLIVVSNGIDIFEYYKRALPAHSSALQGLSGLTSARSGPLSPPSASSKKQGAAG
jgi:hypothetical protein